MEESKPKPLNYDALKSVLKYTSFDKREEIHCRIPQLRKTNAIVPYQFERVSFFSELHIKINKQSWIIEEEVQNGKWGLFEKIPNKCTSRIIRSRMGNFQHGNPIIVDKNSDDAFEELFKTFIKDGTTIKRLVLEGFPEHLFKRNPETFKLKASLISLYNEEDLVKLLPFIDEKSLTSIEIGLYDDEFELPLNMPLIKNCPKLIIINESNIILPWSKVHLLNNEFLEYRHRLFPIHDLHKLVAEWKRSRRPIGTTFLMGAENKDNIIELMNRLKEHLGAKSSKLPASLDDSSNENCITMKMDNGNDTELVIFIGPKKDELVVFFEPKKNSKWPMQMEVMKAGSTILD